MSKEKPILFSTPMVQAILAGQKTMTRRVIRPPRGTFFLAYIENKAEYGLCGTSEMLTKEAPYQKDDTLWVRETWTKYYYVDKNGYTHYDRPTIYYAADGMPDFEIVDGDGFLIDDQRIKWKPSIHMPRKAARIFLRVTNVRVERLQDITEEDALKEGVKAYGPNNCSGTSARIAFAELWDSLNEKRGYGWDMNPWVWVIEFERDTN